MEAKYSELIVILAAVSALDMNEDIKAGEDTVFFAHRFWDPH